MLLLMMLLISFILVFFLTGTMDARRKPDPHDLRLSGRYCRRTDSVMCVRSTSLVWVFADVGPGRHLAFASS